MIYSPVQYLVLYPLPPLLNSFPIQEFTHAISSLKVPFSLQPSKCCYLPVPSLILPLSHVWAHTDLSLHFYEHLAHTNFGLLFYAFLDYSVLETLLLVLKFLFLPHFFSDSSTLVFLLMCTPPWICTFLLLWTRHGQWSRSDLWHFQAKALRTHVQFLRRSLSFDTVM